MLISAGTEKDSSASYWMLVQARRRASLDRYRTNARPQRQEVMRGDALRCNAELNDSKLPRKAADGAYRVSVPQTDSGGWEENSKALERTLVKELGKLTP